MAATKSAKTSKEAKTSSSNAKAKAAKKAALQGTNSHAASKKRTSVSFHRPKTLRLPRNPKYQRKSLAHPPRLDEFRVIVSCVLCVILIRFSVLKAFELWGH